MSQLAATCHHEDFNLSLSVGMIPDIFKVAELLPLLEKQTLIINYFQTFSPFLI